MKGISSRKNFYWFCLAGLMFTAGCNFSRNNNANFKSNNQQLLFTDSGLNNTGIEYDTKGMYDSAAYYFYKALRLAEQTKNNSMQAKIYGNLGILQFELKNADEAIEYYTKALLIAEKLKDSIMIAKEYNNIGNAYATLKNDFKNAIIYFEKCKKISIKINYSGGYITSGISLAQIYNEWGEYDKAQKEIEQITQQYGYNSYASFTLGEIFLKKGNYPEAIQEWKSLLKTELDTREFEIAIMEKIAETYKTNNQPDSTIVYLQKSHALQDSLRSQETYKTINSLKIVYETEEKELQITSLQKEKFIYATITIVGVIILLLLLTILYQRQKNTNQKKQIAEHAILQLNQEKNLVAVQSVLDGEIAERIRIARDLHDGLGGMLSAIKLHLFEMKKGLHVNGNEEANFNRIIEMLETSNKELRYIAHNMMPESLSLYGLHAALTDYCRSMEHVNFYFFGEDRILGKHEQIIAYRIIQELVNNAQKHANATQINVQLIMETQRISITVQDNGKGFNLNSIDETKTNGLANIRSRVQLLKNGILNIATAPNKGTEVNITFYA